MFREFGIVARRIAKTIGRERRAAPAAAPPGTPAEPVAA
jgi:hypothetical protein